MIKIIFWISLLAIVYPYLIYPLLVLLFPRYKIKRKKISIFPISVIIPVRNDDLGKKLENTWKLIYPKQKLEIIAVIDGEDSPINFEGENLTLIKLKKHQGKSTAQNYGIRKAKNKIVVFTDCDSLLAKDSFLNLVPYFAHPEVGCVTAKVNYLRVDNNSSRIENLYWKYENWLRKMESQRGMLTIGSGAFLALPREVLEEIPPDMGDDFYLPLKTIMKGYRVVYTDKICCYTELKSFNFSQQFRMRVRIISKDFHALMKNFKILNPFRYHRYSLAIFSHKLMRWLVPFFGLILFLTNILLLNYTLYRLLFIIQIIFYLSCLGGYILSKKNYCPLRIFIFSYDFFLMNLASLIGVLRAIFKKHIYKWEPIR